MPSQPRLDCAVVNFLSKYNATTRARWRLVVLHGMMNLALHLNVDAVIRGRREVLIPWPFLNDIAPSGSRHPLAGLPKVVPFGVRLNDTSPE
jgi:hypothetical protein